jgi:hypothetical protein
MRQFRIMKEQDRTSRRMEALAEKQTGLIEEQQTLFAENVQISKRLEAVTVKQGEIAELQYQMQSINAEREATIDVYFDADLEHDGALRVRSMAIAPLTIQSFILIMYVRTNTVEFVVGDGASMRRSGGRDGRERVAIESGRPFTINPGEIHPLCWYRLLGTSDEESVITADWQLVSRHNIFVSSKERPTQMIIRLAPE